MGGNKEVCSVYEPFARSDVIEIVVEEQESRRLSVTVVIVQVTVCP